MEKYCTWMVTGVCAIFTTKARAAEYLRAYKEAEKVYGLSVVRTVDEMGENFTLDAPRTDEYFPLDPVFGDALVAEYYRPARIRVASFVPVLLVPHA